MRADPVHAVAAGNLRAGAVLSVPLDGRGHLIAREDGRDKWSLEFENYDGEVHKLSSVLSSCAPHLQMVSPSQYLVFSCRGSVDKLMVAAYDFVPQEMWEEPLGGANGFAYFAYAPEAGRFAMSRMYSTVTAGTSAPGAAGLTTTAPADGLTDPTTAQEVRVYQTESGDLLLKLAVSAGAEDWAEF